MLTLFSVQRSIVWCQFVLCSLPAPASVHDVAFDTLGREIETVEKTGLSSARQTSSTS